MNIRAQTIITHLMVVVMCAFAAWGCAAMLRAPESERVIVMPEIRVFGSVRVKPLANMYVTDLGYIGYMNTLSIDSVDTCFGIGTAPVQMPPTTIHNP